MPVDSEILGGETVALFGLSGGVQQDWCDEGDAVGV
jgi:hypothetical protein